MILVSELKICKVSIIINVVFLLQTDWRERFYAVSNTSKVLQERIEEMRTNNKEKDNTISRLKSRLKDLEEAFEKAYKLSDNKNARLKEENKMFQNVSKKMWNDFYSCIASYQHSKSWVFLQWYTLSSFPRLNAHLREQKYSVDCFVGKVLGYTTDLIDILKQLFKAAVMYVMW